MLHFLVDGVCAAAMFGDYMLKRDGNLSILLYNFCAFALQMPFGIVLDALNAKQEKRISEAALQHAVSEKKKRDPNLLTAVAGVLCTVAGALTHPVLLGIGNALFHVGGGVGTICDGRVIEESRIEEGRKENSRKEDSERKRLLMRLGIFVAPGAVGLYFGMLLAKTGSRGEGLLCGSAAMLLTVAAQCVRARHADHCGGQRGASGGRHAAGSAVRPGAVCGGQCSMSQAAVEKVTGSTADKEDKTLLSRSAKGNGIWFLCVSCLLVVILRSYIGMTVTFPWKKGIFAGLAAVLAIAGGKTAGGFLAAWKGTGWTAAVSLALASVCYLFSSFMPVGLAALFLFNMTMPLTLYWMICALPNNPGSAFGFLTFGLFLGFLPAFLNAGVNLAGAVTGGAGSLLSLLILAAGLGNDRRSVEKGQVLRSSDESGGPKRRMR